MKERLVEDWLIRIHERGYDVPFCQTLIGKGYRVLRSGHSPTEHGKDVLAIGPDGKVYAYQLKTGDVSQSDVTKHHEQLIMLVETRPIHPALTEPFEYCPFLVTTGEFKEPAVSLIRELNSSWLQRRLPELKYINGRQLLVDFLSLSLDFWPVKSPAVREFRELYLVDGRGDLNPKQFAMFLAELLQSPKSKLHLSRQVAAANLFASYLLSEFLNQADHWSVFTGWTICAAQIGHAMELLGSESEDCKASLDLAKRASLAALRDLGIETISPDSLSVKDRELDDFTRSRNTIAITGAVCWQITKSNSHENDDFRRVVEVLADLIQRDRIFFWGESASPHFVILVWFLERAGANDGANSLLVTLIQAIAERNAKKGGDTPFEDPYVSADECLMKVFGSLSGEEPQRKKAIVSYCLLSLVLLAVRRNMRSELDGLWKDISHVELASFRPNVPADMLLWHCKHGKEHSGGFAQPQSWAELREIALRDDSDRLPAILKDDLNFALAFFLVFPHRSLPSLVKHIDHGMAEG